MRRRSDMWQELDEPAQAFLPEVDVQETRTAIVEVRHRLDTVESQVLSQYTSIAAYAHIAQQSVDTARAEARADLDREKDVLLSLIDRMRDVQHGDPAGADAVQRLISLEARFDQINDLFSQCLRNQEELANSIASLLTSRAKAPASKAAATKASRSREDLELVS